MSEYLPGGGLTFQIGMSADPLRARSSPFVAEKRILQPGETARLFLSQIFQDDCRRGL